MMFIGKRISQFKIQYGRCGSIYNNTPKWSGLKNGKPIPERSYNYDMIPEKDEKHPPEKQDRVCNSCYFEVIFLFFVFLIKLKIYICIDQQTIRND